MPKIRDLFIRKSSTADLAENTTVLFSSGEHPVTNYAEKADRSESVNYTGIGRTVYASGLPPTNYDNPITAVTSYPVVYAAVTAISEAISGLGVKVYQVQGGQKVEAVDHPFYQLFAAPNPWQGSFEFMEELQQYLDVCGNAFIAKEMIAGSLEMYLLNPKYVAIIPDPKVKIAAYRFYINGQAVEYKPEEIIHIKYGNVADPYFGLPPLSTATDSITFEKNRLKFINQFFVNGAIPAGVLETEQVLGETLLRKLRGEWSAVHLGVTNSHKVGILQGGIKYKPLTSPIKDLDFTGLKKLSKDDILSIYKIPESILGSQDGTGSTEGKSAITAFWRQCIIPRLKRVESGLNRGLKVELFGMGQYVFEFNLKDVVALQDDKTELSNYLNSMVSSSIMTPNEARAVIGLPKMDDQYSDKLLVSNSFFGNQLMPVEAAAQQGAGSTQAKPTAQPAPIGKPTPPPATPGGKPSSPAPPKAPAGKPPKAPPAK